MKSLTLARLPFLKNVWFLWTVCFVFNIITFLLVNYKIQPQGQNLALKYNVIVGVLWYGSGQNIYFIPGVAALVSLINFILFTKLKNSPNFLAQLCLFTSLVAQIIAMVAILFLIRVN